jgi:hypothetical protein
MTDKRWSTEKIKGCIRNSPRIYWQTLIERIKAMKSPYRVELVQKSFAREWPEKVEDVMTVRVRS